MKTSGKNHRLFYETRSSNISSSLCISGTRYSRPRGGDIVPAGAVERPEESDSDAISARMVSFYYDWDCLSKLINDGFYYTGKWDYNRCFSCGYCTNYMESGGNPWNEHFKWDTDYSFAQRCNRAHLNRSRFDRSSPPHQQGSAFDDIQQSYSTGFNSADNVEVLAPKVTGIFTRNESAGDSAEARDLEEKEHKLCKMCHDKEAWMMFQAYCHLVTCVQCAHALQ